MSISIIPSLAVPDVEPKHILTIDFETFYDADYTLKKISTSDYVRDPRFEMIGVGVDDGDEQVWMDEPVFRAWVQTVDWSTTAVLGHHQHFDGFILSHHYDVHPMFQFCTQSMARTYGIDGGVSLDSLGQYFAVGLKGNEVLAAKGKHRRDFTPEEYAAYGAYCLTDVRITRGVFDKMIDGGFPEPELYLINQTIRMFTQPKFILDEPQLREYLIWERQRKQDLLARIGMDKQQIGSNETLAAAFEALGVEEVPMKSSPKQKNPDGTPKQIFAFSKTDPGMMELLEHENDDIRWLAEARIGVKSTTNETRADRFLRSGKDGARMPVYLNYWKAHTGRWGGSDKRNYQNLGRVDPRKPMSGKLKKSLIVREDQAVVAADSGAIEARGEAWFAGHEELVTGFKENRDLYSDFASVVYGRKVFRKRKEDHPEFNPDDESAGGLGKVAILGLGYQMGWPKFAATLLAGPMGASPIKLGPKDIETMGVDVDKFVNDERKMKRMRKIVSRLPHEELVLHCAVADKIVRTYRTVNRPIVELWKTMEMAIVTMDEVGDNEQFTFGPNDCLTIVRHGVMLPNGLMLRYPGLRQSETITEDEDGEVTVQNSYSYLGQYGKKRKKLYGGLLTENVIQSLSRLVIGEQMLSIEAKYGYEPVLSTHDEIVTIVPRSEAQIATYRIVEEMKISPKWAPDWPLTAEGGHGHSYGDC